MSWGRRLPLVIALGVSARLLIALPVGLVLEGWVRAPTRHQPEGELALFAHGGQLLFERYFVSGPPAAATPMALFSAGLAALVALLPYGLLLHALRNPAAPLRDGIVATVGRLGRLFFLSALQALMVALLVFGALLTVRSQPLVTALGCGGALIVVAALADAARARVLLGGESIDLALAGALRALRRRPAAALTRALFARVGEMAGALAVAWVLATVALRGSAWFFAGVVVALVGLMAMATARAWFLHGLIQIVMLEPLRTTPRLGYDSDPSSEEPR